MHVDWSSDDMGTRNLRSSWSDPVPRPTLLPISPPASGICAPLLISLFQFCKLSIISLPLTFSLSVLLSIRLTSIHHPQHGLPPCLQDAFLDRSLKQVARALYSHAPRNHCMASLHILYYHDMSHRLSHCWDACKGSRSSCCVHWLPSTWHRT